MWMEIQRVRTDVIAVYLESCVPGALQLTITSKALQKYSSTAAYWHFIYCMCVTSPVALTQDGLVTSILYLYTGPLPFLRWRGRERESYGHIPFSWGPLQSHWAICGLCRWAHWRVEYILWYCYKHLRSLRLLQLLLPDCVLFSRCSPIAFTSAPAPQLRLLVITHLPYKVRRSHFTALVPCLYFSLP